jgi:hypothetical protein
VPGSNLYFWCKALLSSSAGTVHLKFNLNVPLGNLYRYFRRNFKERKNIDGIEGREKEETKQVLV